MRYTPHAFRQQYRATISPYYRVWWHAGFVLAFGCLGLGFLFSQITQITLASTTAFIIGLLAFNIGEYGVHKYLGHYKTKFAKLFYDRHTGDHHHFFTAEFMPYEEARDFRVILFPAWLIVLFSGFIILPTFFIIKHWDVAIAAAFSSALLLSYLLYETLHACEHLPDEHFISRLPWIKQMRALHQEHHIPSNMTKYNFNIVFPLTDYLLGTLRWPK